MHKNQTGGGGTPTHRKEKSEKKPPTKKVQPLKDAKTIKKMQGWWVKYAEKSRLEKKTTEGLKRSSIGEVAIVPASSGQARGSDYDHSTVLENSTPRRPIEPEVI